MIGEIHHRTVKVGSMCEFIHTLQEYGHGHGVGGPPLDPWPGPTIGLLIVDMNDPGDSQKEVCMEWSMLLRASSHMRQTDVRALQEMKQSRANSMMTGSKRAVASHSNWPRGVFVSHAM